MGEVYEFSIYHLMAIDDPVSFPSLQGRKIVNIDSGRITK
jgi:hypothetical protein